MGGTFLSLCGRGRGGLGASVIFQGKQGEPGAVIEVATAQPRHEERDGDGHEHQADEDQDQDDVHDVRLSESRQAVRATTPTELTGMRMAATTGVTSPASARLNATRL